MLITAIISNDNCHYRCLAHIINLATQALISTKSKAKYYNPHDIDEHSPDFGTVERDELGLVRAISVKVCRLLSLEWITTYNQGIGAILFAAEGAFQINTRT